MGLKKKYIIAGGIAIVTITGALLYWQYTKLMEYALKLAGVKVNKATSNAVDIDLVLTLSNNSNLKFTIISQEYKVFLNNTLLANITNPSAQEISPASVSPVSVNIKFNPAKVGNDIKGSAADILLNLSQTKVRVDVKLKVGIWLFKIAIPYSYSTTIKDLFYAQKI